MPVIPVIQSGSIRIGEILRFQAENGVVIGSLSGILGFVVILMCIQAKLALVPFDIPEAETEIVSGPLVEYSGTGLAIYRLMKNMLLFTLPFFMVILFMGGVRTDGLGLLFGVLKYVGVVALITVIRNTNPRIRIDQAVKFFWGPMSILAIAGVLFAWLGM